MTANFFDPTAMDYDVSPEDLRRSLGAMDVSERAQVNTGLEADPEQASESIDLAGITGDPAQLIMSDLDKYKQNLKQQTAQALVLDNPDLITYMQSHPLASSISNDDWGNLDKSTRSASLTGSMLEELTRPYQTVEGLVKGIGQGLAEGFGDTSTFGQENINIANQLARPNTPAWALTVEGSAIGNLLMRTMNALGAGAIEGAKGAGEAFTSSIEREDNIDLRSKQFGTELGGMVENYMMRGDMPLHGAGDAVSAVKQSAMDSLRQKYESARHDTFIATEAMHNWLENGIEPPAGVHPLIDEAKSKINEAMVERMLEDLQHAQDSLTHERNPEMYVSALPKSFADSTFEIHADAVLKLYGDKEAGPEDGLLGWVPNINEQLAAARDVGTGVQVRLGDWVGKIDPALAKELAPDIRMWPGGITANEAKEPIEPKAVIGVEGEPKEPVSEVTLAQRPGILDGPLAQVRAAYGLEPKFSMGDRKLSLLKVGGLEGDEGTREIDPNYDAYHFIDDKGQPVGELAISRGEDKTLFVHWIGGTAGRWSNTFGPALMKDIKRQLKELYPEYEKLTGFRITGGRERAGQLGTATVRLEAPEGWGAADGKTELDDFRDMQAILAGGWERYNAHTQVLDPGKEFYTPEQLAVGQAVWDEVQKIVGGKGKADVRGVAGIKLNDGSYPRGTFNMSRIREPSILVDLLSSDPIGTGRHEAIHWLRNFNYFTPEEWATLERTAQYGGWVDKHNIKSRYEGGSHELHLEEAIAEEFRTWARLGDEARAKSAVAGPFQKILDLINQIKDAVKAKLGYEPEWETVFKKAASGEVGARGPGESKFAGVKGPLADRGDVTFASIEGDDAVKAKSVGLDTESFRKIQEMIRKRHEEDIAASIERNKKIETRNQTKEWKANRVEMSKEVSAEIRQRPDIAADLFIGSGEFMGKKVQQRFTLKADDLTPEQKAAIPEHYTSKSGLPADQVAGLFGYGSKDELIEALSRVNELRKDAKGDRLGSGDFLRKMVQSETDRRMEMRYGYLEKNIMEDATDRALSDTNLNIMYEELYAAAEAAGSTVFDKDVIAQAAKNVVASKTVGELSSYRMLQEMGKHARDAEKALVAKDGAAAVVSMQKQTVLAYAAKEAKAVEKEIAQFDKRAKRLAKRDQATILPEYTNWIHSILMQVGKKVARTPEDLAREIGATGITSLEDFVEDKAGWLREVAVWDQLYDPQWKKEYKSLLVPEFRNVKDSIASLVENGRDEKQIIRAGEAADYAEIKAKMIEALQQFKERDVAADAKTLKGTLSRLPRSYLANSLQLENILNRWDRFDPYGVWNQYVMRDLIDAVNQSDAWKKEFATKLGKLKDIVDMRSNVKNDIFKAPEAYGGRLITMNRESLHAVMLNVGNKSNLMKMAKGWGLEPKQILDWVNDRATKADWDRVQAVWDIFDEMKERSDTMYRSMSGVPAEAIVAREVQTPHGTYRGGYYPMIYHETYEGSSRKLLGNDGLRMDGFVSAATPAGYTKTRTGYSAPTAMDLNQLPNRLSQMIHDTSLRPAVVNASKVFKDKEIRAAIALHYGDEYRQMLIPWLKGVANASNNISKDSAWVQGLSDFARQNMVTTLVGLNPGTVLKHGPTAMVLSAKEVGPGAFFKAMAESVPQKFLQWTRSLFGINDAHSDTNWDFAVRCSLELQRRFRHWQETLYGASGELQAGSKYGTWRQNIMRWSSSAVALSDMISAVPTWLAKYHQALEDGASHGDAVYEADRAVRRAHGSTAATNRPAITNQVSPWFSTVYNFFNDVMNRQVETLWHAGEGLKLAKEGNHPAAMDKAKLVAAGMFAYAIWPALVENWVSPLESEPDDSWGKKAAKGMLYTAGASWIGVRDFANFLLQGREPDVGLFSTEFRELGDIWRDFGKNQAFSVPHMQKIIRDASGFAGALTGIPQQIGKELSFAYGVAKGSEHPRGPWGWLVGARYGTIAGHSPTLADYMAGRSLPPAR